MATFSDAVRAAVDSFKAEKPTADDIFREKRRTEIADGTYSIEIYVAYLQSCKESEETILGEIEQIKTRHRTRHPVT